MSRDRRYAGIEVPHTESLKDTIARALPYYEAEIAPALASGKRVLVAAHGNSLRGIIKYLSEIGDEEIVGLEIPTGKPIVYELDDDLSVERRYYLDDAKPAYAGRLGRGLARGTLPRRPGPSPSRRVSLGSITPTPIATLSGSTSPSCRNSQPAIMVDQPRRGLVRARSRRHARAGSRTRRRRCARRTSLLRTPLGQQVRDLDQRLVAGAVAEACR